MSSTTKPVKRGTSHVEFNCPHCDQRILSRMGYNEACRFCGMDIIQWKVSSLRRLALV